MKVSPLTTEITLEALERVTGEPSAVSGVVGLSMPFHALVESCGACEGITSALGCLTPTLHYSAAVPDQPRFRKIQTNVKTNY